MSIPNVASCAALSPILSLLTQPQYLEWSSVIQALSVDETSSSEASLHMLSNVVSVYAGSKVSNLETVHNLLTSVSVSSKGPVSLLHSLSALLNSSNTTLGSAAPSSTLPWLLLFRALDRCDPIPVVFSPAQLEESSREYSMSPGHRKLEYRSFAYQQQLCRKSDAGLVSPAAADSLREVLKFLGSRHVVSFLQKQVVEVKASSVADVLMLCSLYGQTLLLCPAISPVSGNNTSIGDSSAKSLSNSIVFNSASAVGQGESIVVSLWRLIVTHFQPILSLVTVNFSNSFQEAVNTYNGLAISEASPLYPFFFLAGAMGLKPIELLRQVHLLLCLFCSVFTAQLAVLDDNELLASIPAVLMQEIVLLLKGWLHNMYWLEPVFDDSKVSLQDMLRGVEVGNPPAVVVNKYGLNTNPNSSAVPILSYKYLFLIRSQCQLVATRLFQQLCYRNERHPFMEAACYQWPALSQSDLVIVDPSAVTDSSSNDVDSSVGSMIAKNPKVMNVLTFIPQVSTFSLVWMLSELTGYCRLCISNRESTFSSSCWIMIRFTIIEVV